MTYSLIVWSVACFLLGVFGVLFVLLIRRATTKKSGTESRGDLVVDMTEPTNPGLYLSIPSADTINDLLKTHAETVTLNVVIYGE